MKPRSIIAQVDASGILLLMLPPTVELNELSDPLLIPTGGATSVKAKAMARSLMNKELSMTLEVKLTLSPGTSLLALNVSEAPAPKTASVNVPLR